MADRCPDCGLPDPYHGQGDGIGSCECPRCDCGSGLPAIWCGIEICRSADDYPHPDWEDQ